MLIYADAQGQRRGKVKPGQCVLYCCSQYFVDLQNKYSSRLPYGDLYLPMTKVLQARVVFSRSRPVMELIHLQAASASSPSSASRPTIMKPSGTSSQLPLPRAALERVVRLENPDLASIGIDTCGWYEGMHLRDAGLASINADHGGIGTAVTCTSSATCGFSSTFRACCTGHACSSSAFNTACLPYDDLACLAGTQGPATTCWSVCTSCPAYVLARLTCKMNAAPTPRAPPA